MSPLTILLIIATYFGILMLISFIVGRKGTDNDAFFLGHRRSPWYIVSIGMVGASLSGISFVSVPGMVGGIGFTYLQAVIGFFFGYVVVANVLLPLYYKLNLTTIYTYLNERFGKNSYKTGAAFFLLSKTIGAAVRLYIVVLILQTFVFDSLGIPFVVNVLLVVLLIWLYTFRSGIKTIVWTDSLQTIVMIGALVLILVQAVKAVNMDFGEMVSTLAQSEKTRIFVFDDWHSTQNFFKQFFSGIFLVVVMTGLDQDMMQKNLTCKSLPEAKKNMYWHGIAFLPINFLFLALGAVLLLLAAQNNIALPAPDQILPMFASNYLGKTALTLFVIGIVAAAFSSADSALTSLTTSFSVDILEVQHKDAAKAKRKRMKIHIGISLAFIVIILLFQVVNNRNAIDAIFTIVGYSYGPLLGMYAFGLFTKRQTKDKLVPYIAVASPVICFALNWLSSNFFGYEFGWELLMLNGALTFLGMWAVSSCHCGLDPQSHQLGDSETSSE